MKKEKYFSGLELDKIIHILQGSTFTQANENLTYDSLMQNSAEDTRYQLELTDAMYSLYQRFSLPGMTKIADVQNPIYRAQKGGILSLKELLNIGRLMGACKSLLDWYRGCEDHPDVLNGYMDSLTYHDYIHRKISSSVLSEEELADTASEELYIIRPIILFFITTETRDLMYSLEQKGVSHTVSYIMLASFQTIIDLKASTVTIMESQKARGIETEGSIMTRIKAFFPILAPLILGALSSTEEKTIAMDARAFSVECEHTFLRELKPVPAWEKVLVIAIDLLFVALCVYKIAMLFIH